MTEQDNEEKNAQLKEMVRKSEKRASDIVEQLADCHKLSDEEVLQKLKFVNPPRYDDIVEERSILSICGYPMCYNNLSAQPKQQYRIMKNKVYDITLRKMFCSDKCYEASMILHDKIPNTALWLRDNETNITLPSEISGMPGKEVELLSQLSKEVLSDLNELSHTTKNKAKKNVRFSKNIEEKQPLHVNQKYEFVNNETKNVSEKNRNTNNKINSSTNNNNFFKQSFVVLNEWMTTMTLEYLQLVEKKETPNVESLDAAKLKSDESKEYMSKIEQFYKGGFVMKEESKSKKGEMEVTENENQSEVLLPTVDSCSQIQIRRKILYQHLSRYCSNIIPALGLPASSIQHKIREIITTFELTSTNTMLKQQQWPLMTVIIFLLLSNNDEDLYSQMQRSSKILNKLLSAYGTNVDDLNKHVKSMVSKYLK